MSDDDCILVDSMSFRFDDRAYLRNCPIGMTVVAVFVKNNIIEFARSQQLLLGFGEPRHQHIGIVGLPRSQPLQELGARVGRDENENGMRGLLLNGRRALNVYLDDHILTTFEGVPDRVLRDAISLAVDDRGLEKFPGGELVFEERGIVEKVVDAICLSRSALAGGGRDGNVDVWENLPEHADHRVLANTRWT